MPRTLSKSSQIPPSTPGYPFLNVQKTARREPNPYERAEEKADSALKTTSNALRTAGVGLRTTGKTMQGVGVGVSAIGSGLTKTRVGAVVGAPLMAAGGALKKSGQVVDSVGKVSSNVGRGLRSVDRNNKNADLKQSGGFLNKPTTPSLGEKGIVNNEAINKTLPNNRAIMPQSKNLIPEQALSAAPRNAANIKKTKSVLKKGFKVLKGGLSLVKMGFIVVLLKIWVLALAFILAGFVFLALAVSTEFAKATLLALIPSWLQGLTQKTIGVLGDVLSSLVPNSILDVIKSASDLLPELDPSYYFMSGFSTMYTVVSLLGVISLLLTALYLIIGLDSPFGGKNAGLKIGSFLLFFVLSFLPLFNLLPWAILWFLVVNYAEFKGENEELG